MLLLAVLVFFATSLLTHIYLRKTSRIRRKIANMPTSPTSIPLLGCILDIGTSPDDVFHNLVNLIGTLGPTGAAWVGTEAFVVISSPECLEAVLSSKKLNNKPFIYDFFAPYLGLVVASGDAWRRKRKLLTPAFHFQILDEFIDDFNSNALILIKNLRNELGSSGFDIHPILGLCTLDIIAESAMGVKVGAQSKKKVPFNEAINMAALALQSRAYKPWYYIDWIYKLSADSRKFEKSKNIAEEFVLDVIRRKKQQRIADKQLKREDSGQEFNVHGKKQHLPFLDTLLENIDNGVILSEDELKNEVMAFMITGQHTITESVAFTLYALMKNPEVQEKVIKELDDYFGKSDRMPTVNDLQQLSYFDKVIKESLRMFPPVPFIFRSIPKDIHLPDGFTAPRGASFLIGIYNMHHNPKNYPEPHIFDPERFDIENSRKRHPFAYCPFSAGPRNCIGQRFALIETKVLVSTILRNFRILPPIDKPDMHLSIGVVLTSTTGVNLRLEER